MGKAGKKGVHVDENSFLELYMAGLTDKEIAAHYKCGQEKIRFMRSQMDLLTNRDLFVWQSKLRPSQLAKIPEKYRARNLCV